MFEDYPDTMFSNVSRQEIAHLLKEYSNLYQPSSPEVSAGRHACIKCKGWRVAVGEKQTRSGDEGFTVFYKCVDCQHTWKQN